MYTTSLKFGPMIGQVEFFKVDPTNGFIGLQMENSLSTAIRESMLYSNMLMIKKKKSLKKKIQSVQELKEGKRYNKCTTT